MQVSHPEFKHFNMLKEVDEVVEHLVSLLPEGKWTMDNGPRYTLNYDRWRAIVSMAKTHIDLFEHPKMRDLKNVTFETNTTQTLHEDFPIIPNDRKRIRPGTEIKLQKKKKKVPGELGTLLLNRRGL